MLWDALQSVVKVRAKAYSNVEKRYEGGGVVTTKKTNKTSSPRPNQVDHAKYIWLILIRKNTFFVNFDQEKHIFVHFDQEKHIFC